MKTMFASFVTISLATVVVFQTIRHSDVVSRRKFPMPSVPNILRRFQEYAAHDAAALAKWNDAPLPETATASDIVLLFDKMGFSVDGDDVATVVAAIDLDHDEAVSLVDVAYGVATAVQSWNAWQGRQQERMWQLPTAAALRRILMAANISSLSPRGMQDAVILPQAKYPLRLLAALAADAVLAASEEAVDTWWVVLDVNNNSRLDANELRTFAGARWASKLGVTKVQSLQHARQCVDNMEETIISWILQK